MKTFIEYVALFFRMLADFFVIIAKKMEYSVKTLVHVCNGEAYLVYRVKNNTETVAEIVQNDFTHNKLLEPIFKVDLEQIKIELSVNNQNVVFFIRRPNEDVDLINLAKSYSEKILYNNEQLKELLLPKLTEMARSVKPDLWNNECLEKCYIESYKINN